jgi:hypothetical protein
MGNGEASSAALLKFASSPLRISRSIKASRAEKWRLMPSPLVMSTPLSAISTVNFSVSSTAKTPLLSFFRDPSNRNFKNSLAPSPLHQRAAKAALHSIPLLRPVPRAPLRPSKTRASRADFPPISPMANLLLRSIPDLLFGADLLSMMVLRSIPDCRSGIWQAHENRLRSNHWVLGFDSLWGREFPIWPRMVNVSYWEQI